jgi:hypothetical protein
MGNAFFRSAGDVIFDGMLTASGTGTAIEAVGANIINNFGTGVFDMSGGGRFLTWSTRPNDDVNGEDLGINTWLYSKNYGDAAPATGNLRLFSSANPATPAPTPAPSTPSLPQTPVQPQHPVPVQPPVSMPNTPAVVNQPVRLPNTVVKTITYGVSNEQANETSQSVQRIFNRPRGQNALVEQNTATMPVYDVHTGREWVEIDSHLSIHPTLMQRLGLTFDPMAYRKKRQ